MLKELNAILDDVRIDDGALFFRDAAQSIADLCQSSDSDYVVSRVADSDLVKALTILFYREVYTRPRTASVSNSGDDRRFVARLSNANTSSGTWEPGWRLIAKSGEETIVEKHGIQFRAVAGQVRCQSAMEPNAPSSCRVRVGKECFQISPGFYFAIGDAEEDALDETTTLVRLYANVLAGSAVSFLSNLIGALNRAAIPFRAKFASKPSGYLRADAVVLYLTKNWYRQALEPLRAVYRIGGEDLVDDCPLFTKRVGRGIGVAEDPGDGDSFGIHRCRLLARGVERVHRMNVAGRQAQDVVHRTFSDAGIDPDAPHLRAGSEDIYGEW